MHRARGRSLLPSICLLLSGFGCSAFEPAVAPGPASNVLLISLDTVRPDHLGAYGHDAPTSPAVDELARAGALFRNGVAVSPWTLPSHATLLTGVYPRRHGARRHGTSLVDGIPSLSELFGRAGFDTAAIVSSMLINEKSGLDRGFAHFTHISEFHEALDGRRAGRITGGPVTDEAIRWLSDRQGAPFFLFLHYYDVHSGYAARPEHRRLFPSDYRGEINGSTRQLMQVVRGERSLTSADVAHLESLYEAEIRQLDGELERLLRFLEEAGLRGQTAILVTSDHGEEFMEHGGVLHARTYYGEVIGVPLIVSGPGVPAGWRSDFVASHIDVAPTLLALAGQPIPDGLDGVDLSRLWRSGAAPPSDRYVFAEADHGNETPDQYRMVRDGRYKLILNRSSGAAELYDLLADPDEQRDLRREHPRLVEERLAALRDFEAGARAADVPQSLSADDVDALRELGYAE